MQKFWIKTAFFIVLFSFCSIVVNAQPPLKAKDRIMQLKKIKLLEILDLDEQQSQNFLVKYSSLEKKVEEKRKAMDAAIDDLEFALRKKQTKDEINSKTQNVLKAQKEFIEILDETSKTMKSILNEENYGKYLVFEHKFKNEIQKIIMNKMKKGKDKF